MAKLEWDKTGEHFYETGTNKGVLYVQDDKGAYPAGVAWSGLTGVTLSPEGAEASDLYADNIKYLSLISAETVSGTIEAYSSPEEFDVCDGTVELTKGVKIGQQTRKAFGFCWRTILGNDIKKDDYAYIIHIVYNATASPSEKAYTSVNDSPEALTLSWSFDTTPISVTGAKSTATVEIKSTDLSEAQLKAIEDALYGTDDAEAYLPTPDQIKELVAKAA